MGTKEVTRIITMQITGIAKVEDEAKIARPEIEKEYLTAAFKRHFLTDDVVVINVQDFVREV